VPTTTRAAVAVAAIAVLWGSVGVVVREVDLAAVALVSGRIWIAAPAVALFLGRRRGRAPWRWRPTPLLLVNGAVLAVHWVTFIAALQRAPIGTVLLITYLAPVGIAALAPATLGEVVPTRTKVALGVAVAGIALIAIPEAGGADADGVLLAIVTGLLYVALALLNKRLTGDLDGATLTLWQLLIAGTLLLPFAATSDWSAITDDWPWLLAMGLVYTAFAFGSYLTALVHLPATRAAVLLYLEPAAAVVFGWLLLDESLTPVTIAGGVLVVAAGVMAARTPATPELIPEAPARSDGGGVVDVPG
jgi:drug/metabolite transporter (DMT)-like permease